jgi:hypothetical protein
MLDRNRIYFALGLVTMAGAAAPAACGGGSPTTGLGGQGGSTTSMSTTGGATTTSTTTSSSTTTTTTLACPSMMGTAFAVSQLSFGDGNNGEWKSLGFNIDGETWTAGDPKHCKPNSGATPSMVFPNGNNGIDNSFGDNLLPTIIGVDPNLVTDTNNGLTNGIFTVLLKMYCLPPSGDVDGMTTKLFGGTALGISADGGGTQMTPKWDGTDQWPVEPNLLSNPNDPESSTIVMPGTFVANDVYDTGKNQTFVLTLPLNLNGMSSSLKLTMYAAEAQMTFSTGRTAATLGVLGGVLNTEEFVAEIAKVADLLGYCSNSIYPALITKIRQSSDIMADGTQDPTQVCNGISVGLGFQMKEVLRGPIGPAVTDGPACAIPDGG